MCGPVFNEFMQAATAKFGGGPFIVPEEGQFINIDRFTGARLADDAEGDHVVAEFFRDGEEPIFGVAFDGGFAMGSNFERVDTEEQISREIQTSSGKSVKVGPKASIGTLSSGGLY